MNGLSFGEQVKIVLKRKGMTIKELAEQLEQATGRKTSRQNLTQKLGRDNFQEKDMREIAAVLGCPFSLSILDEATAVTQPVVRLQDAGHARAAAHEYGRGQQNESATRPITDGAEPMRSEAAVETGKTDAVVKADKADAAIEADKADGSVETGGTDSGAAQAEHSRQDQELTIGEIYDLHSELEKLEREMKALERADSLDDLARKKKQVKERGLFLKRTFLNGLTKKRNASDDTPSDTFEPVIAYDGDLDEDVELGDIDPKTGHEYHSNSVRMHPSLIGYVQVYDRMDHSWTDMTEWAFLAYQERKQALLGEDYTPPIYLD